MKSKQLQNMFLEYINNFLTVARFAEYYGFTESEAKQLIDLGHEVHERLVAEYKQNKEV
jgi:hypothetical protein